MSRTDWAICTACVLAILGFSLLGSRPSRAAAADGAEIRIFVPSGVLVSKWWVYVDRTLVATYRDRRKQPHNSFAMHESTPGTYSLVDEEGWALTSTNGIARKARAGFVDKYYDRTSIRTNGGPHAVDLVVLSAMTAKLFLVTSVSLDLATGESKTVWFGIPIGYTTYRDIPAIAASRESVQTELSSNTRALSAASEAFLKDQRVSELLKAFEQVRGSDSVPSVVMMNMPEGYGGSREYDGEQVAALVGSIRHDFDFEVRLTEEQRRQMSDAQSDIYSRVVAAAANHNLQIEQLEQLSRRLQRNLP